MAKESLKRCFGCMSEIQRTADKCPRCGYSQNSEYDPDYLKPGKTLQSGRYIVGRLARKNGESAMYVGYDNLEKLTCWIREYFPTKLSRRVRSKSLLTPLDGADAQYKALLSDFIDVCNEVKRLGVTENVIPIIATFSENNTVYAIYQHLSIMSFDMYLEKNGGKISTNDALDLLLPFYNMVATIHDHGHIHRGISPHTVYIDKDGQLYLWDFSVAASRTACSEIDAELFNGYSAPEQYSANGWQGTWTDVYAMAALFYRAVSGFVPPKSTFVGEERRMAPLADLVIDMPANVSEAIEEAMNPVAEKRTQAVYSLTSRLLESEGSQTAVYDASRARPVDPDPVRQKDSGGFKYAILALAFTVLLLVGGFWYVMTKYFPGMITEDVKKPPTHSLEDFGPDIGDETDEPVDSPELDTPRFVGQMLSVIENDFEYKRNFTFEIEEEFNEEFPAGVVFKQSPIADATIARGGKVTLYVSKGSDSDSIMPNIIGLDYAEALQILAEKNIPCNRIERHATGAVAGSVVGTTPAPGAKVAKNESVTVYVMPDAAPAQPSSVAPAAGESASASSKSSSTASSGAGSASSISSSAASSGAGSASSKSSSAASSGAGSASSKSSSAASSGAGSASSKSSSAASPSSKT